MQKRKLTRERSKSLVWGSMIAAFIVASPYLFYLYEGVPDIAVWNFSFLGIDFKYDSQFYQSANVAAWILFGKIFPLLFLLIWFFTCKHWWYHALLIPICMYIIQIYVTLQEDILYFDATVDIYYLAPIILLAFIFLYTIRTKIFDKIHNIDLSELKRVGIKGELNKDDVENEEDEDDEPIFMG